MIFVPYADEMAHISRIQKVRNNDYALLRLTYTMIDKNNLDANGILRDLLKLVGIVDYEELEHGSEFGVSSTAYFIQAGKTEEIKLRFYRVTNKRGDRRFSIEMIKQRMRNREINEGDLLYISAYRKENGAAQLYFINLTHNIPSDHELISALGMDSTNKLYEEIKPKLKEIVNGGFYKNSKGAGSLSPKDVGDTLEYLLGVPTNNSAGADLHGLIELKAKGGKTLDTLFTLRPNFDSTPVADFEPNDRQRVSAFTRLYGYYSATHPDHRSLYITIGSKESPQNNQGFFLEVDDNGRRVNLKRVNPKNGSEEITAFWTFRDLKAQLEKKHPSTLWIHAEIKESEGTYLFKYSNEFEFSRKPQFTTFLSLIKSCAVTYDWRGYTTKDGKYSGKNHGNAWRIKPNYKTELFGEIEKIIL